MGSRMKRTSLEAKIALVRSGGCKNTGTGVIGPVRREYWVWKRELVVVMVRT